MARLSKFKLVFFCPPFSGRLVLVIGLAERCGVCAMSWHRSKLLFALKLYFNWGQFYKEMSKCGYFKKFEKSQNKVEMAEEIGCGN